MYEEELATATAILFRFRTLLPNELKKIVKKLIKKN